MKNSLINKIQLKKAIHAKYLLTMFALISSVNLFAQEAKPAPSDDTLWLFSNGLFDTLLGVVIMLLVIIAVLGSVLKNVARYATEKTRDKNSGTAASIIALILFVSYAHSSVAQTTASATAKVSTTNDYMGLGAGMFYLMIIIIVIELIIVWGLINSIQLLIKREMTIAEIAQKTEPSFIDRISAAVPVEKEADILMDHNYDGIQELDNDLPPWWKYGFYLTIVFAIVYLINFHITKTSDLQIPAYEKAMEAGRIAKEEYQKKDANNVTESNVKMITDKDKLAEGAELFKTNCVVCHGKLGEGIVGPNLTDDYWLHGGSIKQIFHTITFGWPDKGMKSWQADFTPAKINELASYVKTLHGTNPPNGKAPQGDMYVEAAVAKSDSTKTDSAKVMAPVVDSTKAKTVKKK